MAKLGVRINLVNGGLTQVTDWEFNSVVCKNKVAYGANGTGIAEIGSADKDEAVNIDAFIYIPASNFSIQNPKRIRKGYIDYETDGKIEIVCTAGEDISFTVTLTTPSTTDKETSSVFNGNRNYANTHWGFTVSNIDGADFSLDYFGILFIPLTRHRSL